MKVTEKKYLNVHQTISPLTSTSTTTLSSKYNGNNNNTLSAVAVAHNALNGLNGHLAGGVGAGGTAVAVTADGDIAATKAADKLLVSHTCFWK